MPAAGRAASWIAEWRRGRAATGERARGLERRDERAADDVEQAREARAARSHRAPHPSAASVAVPAAPAAGGWAVDIQPAKHRWKCDVHPVLGPAEAVEVRARVAEDRAEDRVADLCGHGPLLLLAPLRGRLLRPHEVGHARVDDVPLAVEAREPPRVVAALRVDGVGVASFYVLRVVALVLGDV